MSSISSPWTALFRDGRGIYVVALNLGIGLHAIDVFVISTVMPAVVRDLGGVAFYAWATMLYMIASIMLPPSERAHTVPRLPFRRLLLLGGGVLAVGIGGTTGSLPLEGLLLLLAVFMVYLTFKLDAESEIPLFPSRAISLNHRVGVAFA